MVGSLPRYTSTWMNLTGLEAKRLRTASTTSTTGPQVRLVQNFGVAKVTTNGRWAASAPDRADVVIVEPYLAGTSTAAANDALIDVPHRVLGLGVARAELRRYGQIEEHLAAHGLDAASLRARIGAFLHVRDSA